MNKTILILLDQRNRRIGGISALNRDLISSQLAETFDFIQSGLSSMKELFSAMFLDKPVIFVFDEAFSWSSLPSIVILKLAAILLERIRSQPRVFVSREHHYSESFVKSIPYDKRIRFLIMLKVSYALMDKVIALSERQKRWLNESNLCGPGKLETVVHSVQTSELLKLSVRDYEHPLVFGFLGRFTLQKGIDRLLKCWEEMDDFPGIRLLICGYGSLEKVVRAQSGQLSNVTLVEQGSPCEFYAKCHGIIIPSRYEPYGQVCVEARAAGRIVIVSDVDALPEQLADGACGYVCDFEKPTELKSILLKIDSLYKNDLLSIKSRTSAGRNNAGSLFEKHLLTLHRVLVEAQAARNICGK